MYNPDSVLGFVIFWGIKLISLLQPFEGKEQPFTDIRSEGTSGYV